MKCDSNKKTREEKIEMSSSWATNHCSSTLRRQEYLYGWKRRINGWGQLVVARPHDAPALSCEAFLPAKLSTPSMSIHCRLHRVEARAYA